ncbi:MAG: hypothetical protein ACI93N_002237, partial [Flavobacteriaceae bacterium]
TRNKFNYFKLDFKYPLDNKILDFKDKIFFQTSSNIIRNWALEYYNLFDKKKFLNLLK